MDPGPLVTSAGRGGGVGGADDEQDLLLGGEGPPPGHRRHLDILEEVSLLHSFMQPLSFTALAGLLQLRRRALKREDTKQSDVGS